MFWGYEACCGVREANESQTSYSGKQGDIFQYKSYSHSDDMFIILKSSINMDASIFHKQKSYQCSSELSRTYQQSAGAITKFSQHLNDNSCDDDKSK
jgi:hypothetical protein